MDRPLRPTASTCSARPSTRGSARASAAWAAGGADRAGPGAAASLPPVGRFLWRPRSEDCDLGIAAAGRVPDAWMQQRIRSGPEGLVGQEEGGEVGESAYHAPAPAGGDGRRATRRSGGHAAL